MEPFQMSKFDGTSTKDDFETFKTKLMAVGALKDGFQLVYLKDLVINPPGTTTPNTTLTNIEKLRSTAMAYLILTTKGAPQDLIKPAGDDSYLAWQLLTARYQPNTIKEYGQLREEMESYDMEDPYDNPELLINRIMRTNARLAVIKSSYGLDDVQIMTMVLGKLPKDLYETSITNIELNGYTSMNLAEFQTKISTY